MIALTVVFLAMIVGLIAGLPVAVTLGGLGLLWITWMAPIQLLGAAHAAWNTATSDVLTSIPLFVLMGEVIQRSKISDRFYSALALWVRSLPGGLLHANIGACGVFAAVSGSSIATSATIGTSAIPSLTKLGYNSRMIFGSLAAGGTLGILIPPSIPLIIYASLTEVSLGRLFIAAMVPGLMMLALFHAFIFIYGWLYDGDREVDRSPIPLKVRVRSIAEMAPLLAIIVVVIAGMYSGWATPTEVAGLGVAISLMVAAGTCKLSWRMVIDAAAQTIRITAMLMFVVIGAQIFAFAVFTSGISYTFCDWIISLPLGAYGILALIVLIYLVIGMFVDAVSLMVLTLSLVFPIILKLGFDPVWWGIVLVLLLEIGLITPPVGVNLYTIKAIAPDNVTLNDIALGALPFVFVLLLGTFLLIAFPIIVLWLPSQMF